MPKLFDKDGNEVEDFFTQEDVDEKIDDAKQNVLDEFEKFQDETDESLKKLEEERDELKGELEKEKEKDKNFSNLRKKKKKEKKRANSLESELASKIESLEKKIDSVAEKSMEDTKSSFISQLTGDDSDLKEKVEHHLENFKEPENKTDLENKIKAAYELASGQKPQNVLSGGTISGAGGSPPPPKPSKGGKKLSPEVIKMAKEKMGITDQDLEKAGYGK